MKTIGRPQILFMADIARAMANPPPATDPQPEAPHTRFPSAPKAAVDDAAKKAAKNERDRQRRKAKRAADAYAAEVAAKAKKAAAKPKKKKVKKAGDTVPGNSKRSRRNRTRARLRREAAPAKRGPGRPPGAKNKPKDANDILAPTARGAAAATVSKADPFAALTAAMEIIRSVDPTHRQGLLGMLAMAFK